MEGAAVEGEDVLLPGEPSGEAGGQAIDAQFSPGLCVEEAGVPEYAEMF